jgi:peptide/nickel transport system substrate-binding protein
MKRNKLFLVVSLIIVATMILAACAQPTAAPTEAPTAAPTEATTAAPTAEPTKPPTTRHGGWFDEVDFSVVTGESVITQLKAGAIDIYVDALSAADLPAIKEAGLPYATASGLYYDLQFNPAVFTDTNVLNPFSDRKIREATNYLFDRDYINQEIYAGGALPKWFAITTQFPDYADLADTARELEAKYAFNPDLAKQIITTEMEGLGATLENGKWMYKGKPVTLIFLIRPDSDGTRKPMGDYIANQFESIGFTVDRQYKTGSEASPIWIGSQPEDGLWHMYTAAWSSTVLDRNQANIFQEMYLNTSAQGIPVFLANQSDPEFQKLGDDLFNSKFNTVAERHDMMKRALELSLQDSLQVFLIDGKSFIPYVDGLSVTYDLAAGVQGSQIWPVTLRWADQEGGTLKWATQDLFGDPWNPIAGSNWAYDQGAIRATQSGDVMYDPYTGLVWPLRIEKAEVVAQTGLPISTTNDWVTLSFQDKIDVPTDAWVDWDAKTQTFITAATKFPDGLTAKRKTTYYYPADLYTSVKWHDGSNFSIADIVMGTIMTFDRAKADSKIYDEGNAVPGFEAFLPDFKGVKIVSTDPLVVEYYTDTYQLDAELNMVAATGWPTYSFGEAPWDTLAIANLAEENGELAYSVEKATTNPDNPIEQTSFIGGPSLEILAKYLDQAAAEKYIPFAPTMSQYLTADEAAARYANLKTFYTDHNHFWVGTGPYVLDKVFLTEKSLVLKNFADYPDLVDRWSNYGAPKIAEVTLDGPGQVKIGDEAVYTVSVSFEGAAYPQSEIKQVKYLLYDAKNTVVTVSEATAVADGEYTITLPKDTTAKLEAGSNKIEVVVVPTVVSVPTFTSIVFVTAP